MVMIIDSLLSANSLEAAGGIAILWIASKLIDKILDAAVQRQIFAPIVGWFKRKIRILLSWKKHISTTFEFSYTPREPLALRDAQTAVESTLEAAEQRSKEKISIDEVHWKDEEKYEGKTTVEYIDGHSPYEVKITLAPDTEAIRESGDGNDNLIGSVNFSVSFHYPFYRLEDTLFNVNSFVSFLEDGLDTTFEGSVSSGRFIISAVDSRLTLDEWIEKEKLQPSLLLSTEDGKTEVEFFPERAVISAPYREVDSETVGYIRAVLINYYLDR